MEMKLNDGKYSIVISDSGVVQDVLRYGESCPELKYLNIIQSMASELSEYRKAQEDGRLKVLPCRVGDTVYYIANKTICDVPIVFIGIEQRPNSIELLFHPQNYFRIWTKSDFGTTVFLTPEEAEATLKELNE